VCGTGCVLDPRVRCPCTHARAPQLDKGPLVAPSPGHVRANLLFSMRLLPVRGKPGVTHLQVSRTSAVTGASIVCAPAALRPAARPPPPRTEKPGRRAWPLSAPHKTLLALPPPSGAPGTQMINWLDLGGNTVPPLVANLVTERWYFQGVMRRLNRHIQEHGLAEAEPGAAAGGK
jgi:hypothetical protein